MRRTNGKSPYPRPESQQRDRFFLDFNETKRQIAQSQRRTERFMCAWAVVLMGTLLFLCWCVYHVLKAKHYVP